MVAWLAAAAVFVRLILCLQVAGGPLPTVHSLWPATDNHFFDVWGKQIARGDLLQPKPLRPMATWMEKVSAQALAEDPGLPARLGLTGAAAADPAAVSARLWNRWQGGATFFQEPAYPYLVGLSYWLAGPDPWHVYAWQLLAGVGGVLLVHALARRLFSHSAAAAAGILALLAPVPLFYEVTLLRDGVMAYLALALALIMHWTVEGPRRRWMVLGLAFGVAALFKQTFLAVPVLLAAWRLLTHRAPTRDRLVAASLVLVGIGAALSPVVLRNLAVGVPALAMCGSAATGMPLVHKAGTEPFLIEVGLNYLPIMLASDGSVLGALIESARTHPSAWSFVQLQLQKLLLAWHGFEAPNNVDFYLFRQGAPLLWFLPARLPLLVPLAAAGLLRAPRRAWPLLLVLAATLAGLVVGTVLSRYRTPLIAVMFPLAGAGVVEVVAWVRARRWRLLGAAALASALYAGWALGEAPGFSDGARAAHYDRGARWFARRSPAFAALHLLEANRLAPHAPRVELRLGELLLGSGDAEAALPWFQAGLAREESPANRLLYARALAAAGRPADALVQVRLVVATEPENHQAATLQGLLERSLGGADSLPARR